MKALSNAVSNRGGENPSSARLTSCTSPEVLGSSAEDSQTGVSSDFVPDGKRQWFVLRATYGRAEKAFGVFQEANIEAYFPKRDVVKIVDGKRILVSEPLLPNIVFAYMTREMSRKFLKEPAPTASWIKYYTDKTKTLENDTHYHPPMIVPDNDMLNFIRLTSINNEHITVVDPERCHFKSGDLVKVVEGLFAGVIGRVGRAAGQQRVIVEIQGLCHVATAYIPSAFIRKL